MVAMDTNHPLDQTWHDTMNFNLVENGPFLIVSGGVVVVGEGEGVPRQDRGL